MIKLIVASRRRAGMTRLEYFRHLQNIHATKILAGPADMLEHLSRYVQTHVCDAAYGVWGETQQAPIEVDSVSEIYQPSPEAFHSLTGHPYYGSVIQPDEHLFADSSTLKLMMTVEEAENVAVPRFGRVKLMHFIMTPDGSDREAFFDAWRKASQVIVEDEVLKPALCGYVRSHALPVPRDAGGDLLGGAPVNLYAGVASLWFDRFDDLSAIDRYRQLFAELLPSMSGLVESAQSFFLIAEEIQFHPR